MFSSIQPGQYQAHSIQYDKASPVPNTDSIQKNTASVVPIMTVFLTRLQLTQYQIQKAFNTYKIASPVSNTD